MTSFAAVAACLLICLVLPVQANILKEKSDKTFFDCGSFQCIDDAGVTCKNNHTCKCPQGEMGDARIECADPQDHCVCTMGGDPHMMTFAGELFTLALPCSHKFAELETTTADFPKGCSVTITGNALYGGAPAGHPFGAYESQVEISVSASQTTYTCSLTRYKDPISSIDGQAFDVKEFRSTGLVIIEVPKCEVRIKYKDDKGLLSVLTSSGVTATSGLCGECAVQVQHVPPVHMDQFDALKLLLESQASSPASKYALCSAVPLFYSRCPEGRKDTAVRFCGSWLEGTRDCIYREKGDQQKLIEFFQLCLQIACSKTSCDHYTRLLSPCTFDGADDFLKDENFCSS